MKTLFGSRLIASTWCLCAIEQVQWLCDNREALDDEEVGYAERQLEKFVEGIMTREHQIVHERQVHYGKGNLFASDSLTDNGEPIQSYIASVGALFPADYFNLQD